MQAALTWMYFLGTAMLFLSFLVLAALAHNPKVCVLVSVCVSVCLCLRLPCAMVYVPLNAQIIRKLWDRLRAPPPPRPAH
jgi:hypothetical protein